MKSYEKEQQTSLEINWNDFLSSDLTIFLDFIFGQFMIGFNNPK